MLDSKAQKKLKQMAKQLSRLEKERQEMEFRPCVGDTDLKQKQKDLQAIRRKIQELEKARDRFILNSDDIQHFQWQDPRSKE